MTSEFTLTTASILADAAILLWPMPEDPFETALWAHTESGRGIKLSCYVCEPAVP